ncbi:MAG: hypothetical protein AAF721_32990 [Myxococcota bacterium]
MPEHRRKLAALRRLARVQKLERDRAAVAMAEASAVQQRADDDEAAAMAKRQALDASFVQRIATVDNPSQLECFGTEREGADWEIRDARKRSKDARRICVARQDAVGQADRRLSMTESLIDKARDALRKAADRHEQMTMDDLVPTRSKTPS